MKYVNLHDICKPKQWKTISISQLSENGFPVYGANGKIGFYSEYTHKNPTLMITCRGATCGNLHISEPFSYINGNAMALDDLDESVVLKYLYFYLQKRGFDDVITGSAQPQITGQGLKKVQIPLPDLSTQTQIAKILDKSTALIAKRKAQIAELDVLVQSVFLEMFGDPITNPKGWRKEKLGVLCDVRDGTHSSPKYVLDGYPLVTSKNIVDGEIIFDNVNLISEEDFLDINKRSKVDFGDILMPMIGTVGNPVIVKQNNPLFAIKNVALIKFMNESFINNVFLLFFLKSQSFSRYLDDVKRGGTQKFISLGNIRGINIICPDLNLQTQFAQIVEKIQTQKSQLQQSLAELEIQHQALMQRAFKGELV